MLDPGIQVAFLMLSALEVEAKDSAGPQEVVGTAAAAGATNKLFWSIIGQIGEFVDRHPSVKVLALAFLIMVGMARTAEAFEAEIPKGYMYAAMAFSLAVEALNIRARARRKALLPRI